MAAATRRLTLIRHAKSSWSDAGIDDFDRELNERGQHDAPMMGRRLKARGARPSLIITSPARRARQTAQLLAREIGYPLEFVQSEPELYLASAADMLAVLARQDPGFLDLVLVGHNPGLTDLAAGLSGVMIDNVPTCGIVALEIIGDDWSHIPTAKSRLEYFDFPKAAARA